MDKVKKIWNLTWCYILAFFIGFPHMVMARYSIPGVDDFSCLNAVDIYRANHSYLVSAVLYTRDAYLTWQGTYTGELIMGLEPSIRSSYLGLRVALVLSVIVFLVGLLLLTFTVARRFFGLSRNFSWAFALICEFISLNITGTGELFSWYTGAAVYTFPLASFLFALAFSIMSFYEGKKYYVILASLFGFIGAGGLLMIVGLGCSIYVVLLLLYAYIIKLNKTNFKKMIPYLVPFLITLAGAIFSTVAPGNYIRQGGSMHVPQSVFFSGVNVLSHVCFMILNYLLPICVVICFIFGMVVVKKNFSKNQLFMALLAFCFITCVTAFPVILGYDIYCFEAFVRSDRVLYVIDFLICNLALILSMMLGCFVREIMEKYKFDVKREAVKIIPLVIIVFLFISNGLVQSFLNGMTMRILDDLKNERIQNVSIAQEDIYREISTNGPADVAWIVRPLFPDTVMYVPFYSYQYDYFGNREVAKYYNCDAFVMEWTN